MLESFTAETFRPLRDSLFQLFSGGHQLDVVLAEVTGPEAGDGSPSPRPFSLLFHGPLKPVWGQRTYQVEHPRLGRFDLFLVPLGPDGGVMRYEAVFN